MANIGICGVGFVGEAVLTTFMKFMHIDNTIITNVQKYDKFKNIGSFEDLLTCNIIFLCLPTPYNEFIDEFDTSALDETLAICANCRYQGLIVIKSTVSIGYTSRKNVEFPELKIINNPEFLSARTATSDFENQRHIILGYDPLKQIDFILLLRVYDRFFPNSKISICKSFEAEMCKLFCNAFYATKVQFFTEMWDLCHKNGIDFTTVRGLMLDNGWINPMHTMVPGPDGLISYGGACFPKDTKALLGQMMQTGSFHKLLAAVVMEQQEIRGD
jgi:UDPglucose 6-dehydrogenase